MRIERIQNDLLNPFQDSNKKIGQTNQVPSFKDTLATFITDVNSSQKVAGDMQKKFLAGEITDVHQVISKSEEANVAFNMLMELKNKSVDGFQEIMRTRL